MHVRATDVTKTYGEVTALDGLSLSIPSGSTTGLLGTNGAGKTTLFRLLIGHETPDEGELRIGETTVSAAGPEIRQRVGYLPEQIGFPPELTAREVLRIAGRIRSLSELDGRIESTLETVGLATDADRPVEGFSNGMRRRLGLATVLVADPQVLLLDEPTAGLDPLGVATFHRIIEAVSDRPDVTVLVCSHALDEIERLCDQVAVLDSGQLRASGSLADVTGNTTAGRAIEVQCETPTERETAVEICRQFGEPETRGMTVVVVVDNEEVVDCLQLLDEAVGLDSVELGKEGLTDRFEELVTDSAGPTTEPTPELTGSEEQPTDAVVGSGGQP